MSVIDEFIASFNRVDQYLTSKSSRKDRRQGFGSVLTEVAGIDSAVHAFEPDLRRLNDLRNMIVHEEGIQGMGAIARPTEAALKRMKHIDTALHTPILAITVANKPVMSCADTATLGSVARQMRRKAYSQIPVLHDGVFTALLTTNIIVRWLGGIKEHRHVNLDSIHITAIIHAPSLEDKRSFIHMAKTNTVHDVAEAFQPKPEGYTINAILITETGATSEPLEGIITAADLPKVHKATR